MSSIILLNNNRNPLLFLLNFWICLMIVKSHILGIISHNKLILLFHGHKLLSVHLFLLLVVLVPLSFHVEFVGFQSVHFLHKVFPSLCFIETSLGQVFLLFKFNYTCRNQWFLALSIFLLLNGLIHFILMLTRKRAQSTIKHLALLRHARRIHHLRLGSRTSCRCEIFPIVTQRIFALLWLVFKLRWHCLTTLISNWLN